MVYGFTQIIKKAKVSNSFARGGWCGVWGYNSPNSFDTT